VTQSPGSRLGSYEICPRSARAEWGRKAENCATAVYEESSPRVHREFIHDPDDNW
jgi:hypothetical protein